MHAESLRRFLTSLERVKSYPESSSKDTIAVKPIAKTPSPIRVTMFD